MRHYGYIPVWFGRWKNTEIWVKPWLMGIIGWYSISKYTSYVRSSHYGVMVCWLSTAGTSVAPSSCLVLAACHVVITTCKKRMNLVNFAPFDLPPRSYDRSL
jgi:hypothetical protein